MLVAIAVGSVFVVLVLAFGLRRRRVKSPDSIIRYSRAVSALRTISAEPVLEPPETDDEVVIAEIAPPQVRVLADVTPIHEHARRRAARRFERPDPEAIARRPVIAHLPSRPQAG
ncbi:MAG TPA: hypothetical protein VL856_06800 [Acidimicrobiia bacterium]|nr:hypothetical protein [Acidimicrobiia bacterium]